MAADVSWDKSLHHVTVNAPQAGLYEIAVDYASIPDKLYSLEHGIQINGKCPFYEARRIVFCQNMSRPKSDFRAGRARQRNDTAPTAIEAVADDLLRDASYLNDEPL